MVANIFCVSKVKACKFKNKQTYFLMTNCFVYCCKYVLKFIKPVVSDYFDRDGCSFKRWDANG